MPRLELGGRARDTFKDLNRNAGVGADRFRAEYLIRLVRGVIDDVARTEVFRQWDSFADKVVNNDLPEWFYLVSTTALQFAPVKEKGATPSQDQVRPVGCGGMVRRAVARMVKFVKKDSLRKAMEPVQLGQGTSGGTQALAHGMAIHMEVFKEYHIIAKDDIQDAFQSFDRAGLMELCQAHPEYQDVCRYMQSELQPKSHIFTLVDGKLQLLPYRSVQGGQQGALSACIGHNIVTHQYFKEVDDSVKVNGGCARAITDDILVAGTQADVWAALQRKNERLERIGMRRHPAKSVVWSPSGQYGDLPEGYRKGSNGGGDTGLPIGFGIVVAGGPIGDETFRRNHVTLEARRVRGVIDSTLSLLRTSPESRDHAFHVHRLSLGHL